MEYDIEWYDFIGAVKGCSPTTMEFGVQTFSEGGSKEDFFLEFSLWLSKE